MRFARLALAAFAAAFCLASVPALASTAQTSTYYATVDTHDPATITTAQAFTYPSSGTIDTGTFDSMTFEVVMTTGNARSFIPTCYAEAAGTTVTYKFPTMAVDGMSAVAYGRYVINPLYGAATDDTGTTASPSPLCRYMKITAASAGAGTFSLTLRRR